jgi:glucokinase
MKKLYIDLGGTHLRSELHGGDAVLKEHADSQATGLAAYIDARMAEHPEIGFIGVSYAGQVHEGRILSAPNLTIDEPDIKAAVEARYPGVRLEIDNDLNCAVMAEAEEHGVQSVAALYIGTGLGAAVIDGGRLVRGGRNLAFELGHIPYREAPFVCGCGRTNCVELSASGSGMQKRLRHHGSDQSPNLERFRKSAIAFEAGVAEDFEQALLYAAGTLVTLANPDLLVLGGGIAAQNPYLKGLLENSLERWTLGPSLQGLRIELSTLENAPLEGTKLLETRRYG